MIARRTILRGGTVVDGTGAAPFRADLAVRGDRIEALWPGRMPDTELRADDLVHDVAGAWVAPGFIDCHAHGDLMLPLPGGLAPKMLQGVTTEFVGQCGLSVFPLPPEKRAGWRKGSVIGSVPGEWGWESAARWFAELNGAGLDCNAVPFVGHGTVRYGIAADRGGPLDAAGLDLLEERLVEAFDAGAAGLSFGLIYLPALFAGRDELLRAARVAARRGKPLAVHMRSESDELLEAVRETVALADEAGVRLHLSHLKAIGQRNRAQLDEVLEIIERRKIGFDHYPYTSGSTTLLSILPPDLFAVDGIRGALAALDDAATCDRLEALYSGRIVVSPGVPWDNLPHLVGWGNIRIVAVADAGDRDVIGLSLAAIGERDGVPPARAAFRLLRNSEGNVRMIDEYMDEEALLRILACPLGGIASDALFGGRPHPRLFGCFPHLFERYVFGEKKVLTVEEAVRKMTGLPAGRFGLTGRGRLAPGMFADIAVFGSGFRAGADEKIPDGPASGLRLLLVNGTIRVRDDWMVGTERTGRLLI